MEVFEASPSGSSSQEKNVIDKENKSRLQKKTEKDSSEIFDFQNPDYKESDEHKLNGNKHFPINADESNGVNEISYSGDTQQHENGTQLKSILKDDNIEATSEYQIEKKINFKESANKKDIGYYRSTPQQNHAQQNHAQQNHAQQNHAQQNHAQQNNTDSSKQRSIKKPNRDEYVPPIPEIIVHDEEGYKIKQDSYVAFDLPNKKGVIPFTGTKSCCEAFEYNDLYIRKYWDGRLKVMQFIATLGISICLPPGSHFYYPRFIYFRVVGITACLFVINDLFLHLSSLWELLPKFFRYRSLHMILDTVCAICMLVGASLILNVAGEVEHESMSLLSVFFGFASMLLFGIETILHLLRQRSEMPYTSKP